MGPVFKGFLDISISAGVVALLILLLRAVLGSRMKPLAYRLLWLVLVLRLVLPFSIESPLSLFNAVPANVEALEQARVHVWQPQPQESRQAGTRQAVAATRGPASATGPAVKSAAALPVQEGALNPSENRTYPADGGTDTTAGPGAWDIAGYVWLTGCTACLGYGAAVNIRFAREVHRSREVEDPAFMALLNECAALTGVRMEKVRARRSKRLSTPAVWGAFKPVLLIPPAFFSLGEQEKKCILVHELTHIRSYDVAVSCGMLLLNALHWFNPVLFFAFKAMRRDMETICDYRTLNILGCRDEEYASTLITAARNADRRRMEFIMAAADGKADLKRRIRRIMQYGKARALATAAAVLLIAAIAVAGCTSAVKSLPDIPAEKVVGAAAAKPGEGLERALTNDETAKLLEYVRGFTPKEIQDETASPSGSLTLDVQDNGQTTRYILSVYEGYNEWELTERKDRNGRKWRLSAPEGFGTFVKGVMEGGGWNNNNTDMNGDAWNWNSFIVYAWPDRYSRLLSSTTGIYFRAECMGAAEVTAKASAGEFVTEGPEGLKETGNTAVFTDKTGSVFWKPGESDAKEIAIEFTANRGAGDTLTKTVKITRDDTDGEWYTLEKADGVVIGDGPELGTEVTVNRLEEGFYSYYNRVRDDNVFNAVKDLLSRAEWEAGKTDAMGKAEYRFDVDGVMYDVKISERGLVFKPCLEEKSCLVPWEQGGQTVQEALGLNGVPVYAGPDSRLLYWIDDEEEISSIKDILGAGKWETGGGMSPMQPDYAFMIDRKIYGLMADDYGYTLRQGDRTCFMEKGEKTERFGKLLRILAEGNIKVSGEMTKAVKAVLDFYGDTREIVAIYSQQRFEDGTLVLADAYMDGETHPELFYVNARGEVESYTSGSYCWVMNFTEFKGRRIFYGLANNASYLDEKSKSAEKVTLRFDGYETYGVPDPIPVAVKNPELFLKRHDAPVDSFYGRMQGYIVVNNERDTPLSLDVLYTDGSTASRSDLFLQGLEVPDYLQVERSAYVFQYNPMMTASEWKLYPTWFDLETGEYRASLRPSGVFQNADAGEIMRAVAPFAFSYSEQGFSFPAGGKAKLVSGKAPGKNARITLGYSQLTPEAFARYRETGGLGYLRSSWKPDKDGILELSFSPGYYMAVLFLNDPGISSATLTYAGVIRINEGSDP